MIRYIISQIHTYAKHHVIHKHDVNVLYEANIEIGNDIVGYIV